MIKILSLLTTNEEKLSFKGYFLTFILLSLSGNPFFVAQDSVNKSLIISISILFPILIFKIFKHEIFYFYKYMSLYIILYVLQAIFVSVFDLSSTLFIVLKTWVGFLFLMILNRKFIFYYINLISIIAAISLLGYLYNTYIGLIPGIPLAQIANSLIIYTQLFGTWSGEFIQRNSGMFWEPGAFGGYLNLAIFFMIISKQFWTDRLKTVVIVAALFTTYSTTGYVVFFFQVILFININEKFKTLRIPVLLLFLIAASYYFYQLDFLQQKLSAETSKDVTEEGRLNSYSRYADILLDNILIGISYTSKLNTGGNGFTWHLASVGIIGTIYYYIMIFVNGVKSLGRRNILIFVFITILLLQGEGFLMYPLFLAFPFIKFPIIQKNINSKILE